MWTGEYLFVLRSLVLKDFRIRYRNMSLGVLWSVLNPLVMMAVFSFVFGQLAPNQKVPYFPVFIIAGIVPFNFLTLGALTGTLSLAENANLIKRLTVPRELIPVAGVLSLSIHLAINVLLMLVVAIAFGLPATFYWLWVPLTMALLVVLACGCSLALSGLQLMVRDTRYVVESFNAVLFWLVPVVYPETFVEEKYRFLYDWNPVACALNVIRDAVIAGRNPELWDLSVLTTGSVLFFATGVLVFRSLRRNFYNYL